MGFGWGVGFGVCGDAIIYYNVVTYQNTPLYTIVSYGPNTQTNSLFLSSNLEHFEASECRTTLNSKMERDLPQ